jgi:hypothetical protein
LHSIGTNSVLILLPKQLSLDLEERELERISRVEIEDSDGRVDHS